MEQGWQLPSWCWIVVAMIVIKGKRSVPCDEEEQEDSDEEDGIFEGNNDGDQAV